MPNQPHNSVSPEILAVLARLRRRIRRYVFLEGTALVLVVLGLLFWVSFGIDALYFSASRLELPRWFRVGFNVVAVSLLALTFTTWVALRSMRRLRARALALLLEKRFPELDDRLITAVEFSETGEGRQLPLTASMLDRTIQEVARAAGSLDIGEVFQKKPLRRSVTFATVLLASIGGLWLTNAEAMDRWVRAFIARQDDYWNRETLLAVQVIAQPGDRIREFDSALNYKHPRGSDLTLLIEVPETASGAGKAWKTPDRVQLQYRLADGRGSGTVTCMKVGDRQFKYSIAGLLDSMEFWITGGDYTNRDPYRVTVVNAPRIDRVVLHSLYPEYTGLNRTDGEDGEVVPTRNVVQGSQISLPAETQFDLQAQCNKPLVGVRMLFGSFELTFGRMAPSYSRAGRSAHAVDGSDAAGFGAALTLRPDDGGREVTVPLSVAARSFLSDGSTDFSVPFRIVTGGEQVLAEQILAADAAGEALDFPLILPADSLVRVYLEDIDEIIGNEPARLTINGIVDQPPTIETELRGISTSITRKAVIPFSGRIIDDYGVATARFEYLTDDEQEPLPARFRNPPRNSPKDFPLRMAGDRDVEQFEVFPLDLSIGQTLKLWVYAEDGDDLNGPHASRGRQYTFSIVSNEELMSILHDKELNLRRRFEQIISELKDTQRDLIRHRARAGEAGQLRTEGPRASKENEHAAELRSIDSAVSASAERGLHAIRKAATETASVEQAFRDVREELVNNAIHTPQLLSRLGDRIIDPLGRINTVDYPEADGALVQFRLANEREQDPTPQIDECVLEMTSLIDKMEQVLLEMRKLETFQEALELLKAIIAEEERLVEETKNRQKRNALEKLKNLGLDD
jgi:hypothetical protein